MEHFYAHENKTVLVRSKIVCTADGMTNVKDNLRIMDFFEHGISERANSKRKFSKLTNVTVSASSLKSITMGCKTPVLPKPFLKNRNVNCPTFDRNT